jgi:methylated-DNA-[protein]-cysteine S-methyltransferase
MNKTFACELALHIHVECNKTAIEQVTFAPCKERGIVVFVSEPSLSDKIFEWISAYSKKKPIPLDLPFAFENHSSFSLSVLEKMKAIPFGMTTTYGEISSHAPRAVGRVCHCNPFPLFYPCHRVVEKKRLGGFAYGSFLKQELLDFEKVT